MLPSLNPRALKSGNSLLLRPERNAILNSLRNAEMVLVAAPNASGLTTLLADVADLGLNKRFVSNCYISGYDLQGLSPAECFLAVLSRLGELLPLNWQLPECNDGVSFRRALLDILATMPQQVVLIIDDLQAAPATWLEAWLNLLRGISHEKHFQPFWQKLSCLLGTHELNYDPTPVSFLTCYQVQPVGRQAMLHWLALKPELENSISACLALAAWVQGNPVSAERLLRFAPAAGFTSPGTVFEAAADWAKHQTLPEVSDVAHRLLEQIATCGPLRARRQLVEQQLMNYGLLRQLNDRLHWSSPVIALAWKMHNPGSTASAEQALLLDQQQMEVYHGNRPILLNPQEMRILFLLANHPGRFFNADAIYRHITDEHANLPFSANVRAQIARLRKKLPSPDYLQTRRNIGYAFESQLPYEIKQD